MTIRHLLISKLYQMMDIRMDNNITIGGYISFEVYQLNGKEWFMKSCRKQAQGAVWFIEIYSTMENSSEGC